MSKPDNGVDGGVRLSVHAPEDLPFTILSAVLAACTDSYARTIGWLFSMVKPRHPELAGVEM